MRERSSRDLLHDCRSLLASLASASAGPRAGPWAGTRPPPQPSGRGWRSVSPQTNLQGVLPSGLKTLEEPMTQGQRGQCLVLPCDWKCLRAAEDSRLLQQGEGGHGGLPLLLS